MKKLNPIILKKEIDSLLKQIETLKKLNGNHSFFIGWRKDVEIFLYVAFGKESETLKNFCSIHFFSHSNELEDSEAYLKGLEDSADLLKKEREKLGDVEEERVVLVRKRKEDRKGLILTIIFLLLVVIYILVFYGKMIG